MFDILLTYSYPMYTIYYYVYLLRTRKTLYHYVDTRYIYDNKS